MHFFFAQLSSRCEFNSGVLSIRMEQGVVSSNNNVSKTRTTHSARSEISPSIQSASRLKSLFKSEETCPYKAFFDIINDRKNDTLRQKRGQYG
jgi:hypothetical protein